MKMRGAFEKLQLFWVGFLRTGCLKYLSRYQANAERSQLANVSARKPFITSVVISLCMNGFASHPVFIAVDGFLMFRTACWEL